MAEAIEIRRLAEEEFPEGDLLWLQSFERGYLNRLEVLPEYRIGLEHRITRFGLWDGLGMQATCQMYDVSLSFGSGVILPATVISSISCAPAARGRGYGGAVLKYMLGHMREAGQVLTILSPFNYAYYRKFGWDWIKVSRTYRVLSRVLPVGPETDHVRAATSADRSDIKATYEQFSSRYRGMAVRDEAEWNLILSSNKVRVSYVYVFEIDDMIEGYLVVREGGPDETYLPEFITVTPRALRGLLGLLRRLETQTNLFYWYAPENDGLWSHFLHREIYTNVWVDFQGRVVDLAASLQFLKPDPTISGSLTLHIEDSCAPWNQGIWDLSFANGVVAVRSTTKEAQVSMDIQAFSQAFFGGLPLTSLREQRRVEVASEPAFHALRSLLDGPPMWYNGPL